MAKARDEADWLRAPITMLEAQVGGLQYELRVRDLRLKEQAQRIAELEQPYERFAQRAKRLVEGYSVEEVRLLVRHFGRLQELYLTELERLRSSAEGSSPG